MSIKLKYPDCKDIDKYDEKTVELVFVFNTPYERDEDIEFLEEVLCKCPNLERLALEIVHTSNGYSDKYGEFIPEDFQYLQACGYECDSVYSQYSWDEVLMFIEQKCKKLKHFVLENFGVIEDEYFANVLEANPDMRSLYLVNCYTLTDKAFENLSEFCPHLSSVTITRRTILTDVGLARLCVPSLRHLHVHYGWIENKRGYPLRPSEQMCNFTAEGLCVIGEKCPKLRELDVSCIVNPKYTLDWVSEVRKGCPELKKISSNLAE